MKPKLYLDEDVHKRAAQALRLRGHDVVSTHEVSQNQLPDEAQFAYAVQQGRALVSFNIEDFARLASSAVKSGQHHPGVILSRQLPIGPFVRALAQFLESRQAEDLRDGTWWL